MSWVCLVGGACLVFSISLWGLDKYLTRRSVDRAEAVADLREIERRMQEDD